MVIPSHVLIYLTQNIKEDYTMEKYIYNIRNRAEEIVNAEVILM